MKRRYAVRHGDTITVFSERLEEAIAYLQARPGSMLVYKAHGRWGGQQKRSTRWLRVAESEITMTETKLIPQPTALEIESTHRLLIQLVLDSKLFMEIIPEQPDREYMLAALDALCWTLGHGHNQAFGKHIACLRREMIAHGVELTEDNRLQWLLKDSRPPGNLKQP